MTSPSRVGVGVIGLGFMGQTHIRSYAQWPERCRLVAVCDRNAHRLVGNTGAQGNIDADRAMAPMFDPDSMVAYHDADEILRDPQVDLVSICTPTDTHVALAARAMEAGKHVLVEKPIATRSDEVVPLIEQQGQTSRHCQPAMCMRFWPGWSWLKDAIDRQAYGPVLSARFERLGGRPGWGEGFYQDDDRSGGALFDLHVHDVDMIRWLFGPPAALHARGDTSHVATAYRYGGGPSMVSAVGGWLPGGDVPFRMRYIVTFEHATAEFNSQAERPLTLTFEGRTEPITIESGDGYQYQARAVVDAIRGERAITPTLDEALEVTRLLEAERESLRQNGPIEL
ncbi:MAG: Gfo/Idh/MocA family oxidoreductase [Planctomycetota bacterium]